MHSNEHAVSRNRLLTQHQEIRGWLRDSEYSLEMLQLIRHGTARHLSDLLHRLTPMIEQRFLSMLEAERQYLVSCAGGAKWDLPRIAAQATESRTLDLMGDAISCADRAVVSFDPEQVVEAIRHVETLIAFIREYIEIAETKLHRLAERLGTMRMHQLATAA